MENKQNNVSKKVNNTNLFTGATLTLIGCCVIAGTVYAVETVDANAKNAPTIEVSHVETVEDNTSTIPNDDYISYDDVSVEETPISSEEILEPTEEKISEEPTSEEVPTEEVAEEPVEEEPEIILPSFDPEVVYSFKDVRALIKEYPEELNGSYVTMTVRVQGSAFGVPGCCFFNDVTDKIYSRGHIEQSDMEDMVVRFDVGNNNAGFSRTEIVELSGYVTYEHNSYLGVDLIVIE